MDTCKEEGHEFYHGGEEARGSHRRSNSLDVDTFDRHRTTCRTRGGGEGGEEEEEEEEEERRRRRRRGGGGEFKAENMQVRGTKHKRVDIKHAEYTK
jgi:hypothetical protein